MTQPKPVILLAEDEEHIARLVAFKLGKEGFEVVVSRNGDEALQAFGSRPWAAVLLDVMMPLRNGWEVLQEIRARDPSVPVLMLTAKGDPGALANAAQLGATGFVKKPFDPAELASKVRQVVSENSKPEVDSEMAALTRDFVASFAARAAKLEDVLGSLASPGGAAKGVIHEVAHNLAGAAESYGFPSLTLIGGALDDYLSANAPCSLDEVARFASLFARAIREAEKTGKDPIRIAAEAATRELIFVSECRASGASSGSS